MTAVAAVRDRFRSPGTDRGSAVAEFAMVGSLVVLLFLAAFQVGFSLFVRNTLIADAAEGARYGARADESPGAGAQRARDLIGSSVSSRYARHVTASVEQRAGVTVVVVRVRAPLPVVGPFGPSQSLDVSAHAYEERQ
ncbi:TadE/TadG family type IV pilus assembly protein [Allobranchiibius sp. CTAmp26]|uniref:TadE/TadG family type IV pilus assembly protein n=1 Tax=Allobranchiibius sp. CTAmp26 TaxID=2815214 RepID=UPI001AA0B542|nr:TadE family protein [Allobranchiibius sp. CTAmp26]MBO1755698.1 pilus assembly protein [Allobranchiibius sp. CTAmp26]